MPPITNIPAAARLAAPIALALVLTSTLVAQNGRPTPAQPVSEAVAEEEPPATNGLDASGTRQGGRRPVAPGKVVLAFDDVSVEEVMPFIVEATGKVVIPVRLPTLRTTKITLVNNEPIERAEALDKLFEALRLNSIGIIEQPDLIILDSLTEISRTGALPIITADESVMDRRDKGAMVVKIFRLTEADAESIGEQLSEGLPDYASMTVDGNSNQIVLTGDIALAQHYQKLINELDNDYINVRTQTFRLRYADASEIADNILDLFEQDPTSAASRSRTTRTTNSRSRQQPNQTGTGPGPEVELRTTVNVQQNSVTVQAAPSVVSEIERLIDQHWDLPRPPGTSKVYTLQYTDPIKVRDVLQEIISGGSGGGGGAAARGAGGGGRADVQQAISGVYSIEAYPDTNSLIVISKTEQSFDFLDEVIESIDRPTEVGLPFVIELKHANAVDLADELNVLLAEAGTGGGLTRPGRGLTGEGIGTGQDADAGGGGREATDGGTIEFPWQRGRQRDDQSPETPLIGKVRIVPIIRQNAVSIVSPPAYRDTIINLVRSFDKPSRQVMISAIIAEVELTDELALGLRVSNSPEILGGNPVDNRIGITTDGSGAIDDILSGIFDTSVLNVGFGPNIVLQALDQETNVRVLQEPRIFTADNQEAEFFDGQDIPLLTNSQTTAEGTVNDSFERRLVGVNLNARPRITAEGDVDMEIYLELSSIAAQQGAAGGFIIDSRFTSTQIIVKNGQTIVLSGLLREFESDVERKVPFFGDIPILGALFTSVDNQATRTELIAFITPTVVESPDANDYNFNADEREHLERLTRPLDTILEEQEENPTHFRDRLTPMRDMNGTSGTIDPESLIDAPSQPQKEDDGAW